MKKSVRLLSALLALLLLVLLAACSETGTGSETGTTASGAADTEPPEETVPTHDAEGYLLDALPDDLNYGGATVTVLYWKDVENPEYFAEEITSDLINDAIYRRNDTVGKRLGVQFDFVPTVGNSGHATDYYNFVKNAVNGGTKYDVISAHSRSIGLCAYHGLTQDLQPLEYLDLDKPWWQDSLMRDATVNGQLHFVSGDISTNMLYMMYVVFYNKELLNTYHLADPYDCVNTNTWTIDKMIELSSGLYVDLDHDGQRSDADQYAQSVTVLHTDAYLWGSGILGLTKNADDSLVFDESFTGERCISVIDKLYNYFNVSGDAKLYESGSAYKTTFAEGRSLFITDRADIAINDLNDKTFTELGIVPVPKYNADQERFLTIIGNPFSLYAVPTNAADPEMSGAVLECLASESYRQVTPVIFDITMKTRYSTDSRDAQMYDLARAGAVYDLSRIFWKVFSTASCDAPDTRFENALFSGSGNWASDLRKADRLFTLILKSLNEAF